MSTPNAGAQPVIPPGSIPQVCETEKCRLSEVTTDFQDKFRHVSECICIGFLIVVGLGMLAMGFIYHPLGYGLSALMGIPSFLYLVGSFYLKVRHEFRSWNYERKYGMEQKCGNAIRDSNQDFYEAYTIQDKLRALEETYGITSLQFYMAFKDNNLHNIVDTLTAVEWMGLIYKYFELGEADPSLNKEQESLTQKGE